MLPIRWDPFREANTLHREFDELFRRAFGAPGELAPTAGREVAPLINTYLRDNKFFLSAELPGMKREDLEVNVEGNMLTIRGERKMQKEVQEKDFLLRESHFGNFSRRLQLPEGANSDKIQATYENGILEITMPISKEVTHGRRVMIQGGKKELH